VIQAQLNPATATTAVLKVLPDGAPTKPTTTTTVTATMMKIVIISHLVSPDGQDEVPHSGPLRQAPVQLGQLRGFLDRPWSQMAWTSSGREVTRVQGQGPTQLRQLKVAGSKGRV